VDTKSCKGTPLYQAPELKSLLYKNKVDIYSAGLSFLEMVCCFDSMGERASVFNLFEEWSKIELEQNIEVLNKFSIDHFEIHLVVEMTKGNVDIRPDAKWVVKIMDTRCIPCKCNPKLGLLSEGKEQLLNPSNYI